LKVGQIVQIEDKAVRLAGKVALVTGGAVGIGRSIAEAFLREGARVALSDVQVEAGERARQELQAFGEVLFVPGDVSRSEDARRMVERTVEVFGRLDVLVNNAGVTLRGTVVDTEEPDWDRVMAVNLKGVYLCSKYAIPHMIRGGGGSIINIGSIASLIGLLENAAYNASKGGVLTLTRNMALDYARYNIRVNAICPAMIMTPMLEAFIRLQPDPEAYVRSVEQAIPLGRIGRPEDVAPAAVFLASDESRFITGSALMVDGGYTAR
jgi:NAD(P)-dependent dehydrogenase (short-subunit alcohol dehydrogenase family)